MNTAPNRNLDFTPGQPWEEQEARIADTILDALADRCCRSFPPSQVARFANVDTYTAAAALKALAAEGLLIASGNGAWTRYEYPTSRPNKDA